MYIRNSTYYRFYYFAFIDLRSTMGCMLDIYYNTNKHCEIEHY